MTAPSNGVSTPADATVAKLLDLSGSLDIALLDATVNAFYGAGSNDQVCRMCCCTPSMNLGHELI